MDATEGQWDSGHRDMSLMSHNKERDREEERGRKGKGIEKE